MTDPLKSVSPLKSIDPARLRERRSVKWRLYDEDVLPLFVAELDTEPAPPIARGLREAVERGDTGYPHPGGFPEAFAGFARRRYGWELSNAPRLVPDVMTGLAHVIDRLTEPGDKVVFSTPAYPPFFRRLTGRRTVSSPLRSGPDGFALDLERLAADFADGAKVYLLCNPHNPAGLAYTREELLAVAGLAERHGVRVVVDEIHAPLTMPGVPHVPFASLDTEASSLAYTAVSASKAWNVPGLKAALVVPGAAADPELVSSELGDEAGLLGVIAGEAAFAEGEVWLDALREDIADNHRLLAGLLAERLPEVVHRPAAATYLAWLDLRPFGLGDNPAAVLLEKGRVALGQGPDFGAEGAGFVRFNLGTSPEVVSEGVDRIAKAVR